MLQSEESQCYPIRGFVQSTGHVSIAADTDGKFQKGWGLGLDAPFDASWRYAEDARSRRDAYLSKPLANEKNIIARREGAIRPWPKVPPALTEEPNWLTPSYLPDMLLDGSKSDLSEARPKTELPLQAHLLPDHVKGGCGPSIRGFPGGNRFKYRAL